MSTLHEFLSRWAGPARWVGLGGAVLVMVAAFLPWAYLPAALDNVTYYGEPSILQWLGFALGFVTAACLVASPILAAKASPRTRRLLNLNRGATAAATASLVYQAIAAIAVALELGGLITLEPGAWLGVVGAAVAALATRALHAGSDARLRYLPTPAWAQILGIVVVLALVLVAAAYGLGLEDPGAFVAFGTFCGLAAWVLARVGIMGWISAAAAANRSALVLASFVVAFVFPFTQNGSDANMSIAAGVLIFAATAMGLNIVVGLAGLLDLGYIAFLGAGAFTAATLSESAFATLGWHPPFPIVMLIAGCVSALLGLLIGSPTLRVSGDYLAIVTLAFGEIFRITMNNLDGSDGPNITRGSNGIPAIPNLDVFGFNFGESHVIAGFDIGRFANYYWLLLLVLALIIVVFVNLNKSRIGRGWVAIREDERAAEAMGVNVFGLKLLAFAGGAFLAGVAGSVKAHVDVSVTPDQYVFMESAFLVAGIVLGGMGTVGGVLVGAAILKLLPEKLRFFEDYRLLLFGLLLIVMMRFRPEGLLPDQRRQLEFHAEDDELAEEADAQAPPDLATGGAALSATKEDRA